MTIKESNWADELKDVTLVAFNNYDGLISQLHAFDDKPYQETYKDEVFQWYIADIDDKLAEYIKKRTMGEIEFYWSDVFGLYILPVMHFGTPWSSVKVKVEE